MKQIRLLSMMAMVLWASALSAQSHWQCDYAKFSESMAIYFQMADGDNAIADVTPYEVAAFVGEECRGVATFHEEMINEKTVKYGYLRIYSNAESAEKIILKVYNKSTQLEKRIAISSFPFEKDKRIGVPSEPVKYDITANVPQYQLTVTPQDAEMGTAEGSGTFEEDEIVHIKATANTGYHFVKWSDEDTDEERAIVITQKTDLVAVFAPNQHLLTFISEGDTVRSALQDYNSTIVPPENPQKEGYSFVKWVPNLAKKMPNNALTYEATYKINEYTMTFMVDGKAVREAILEYGKPVPVPQSPSKTAYTFAGWDPVVPATVPGSNMTFTAQWTPITYSISYDLAGGQLAEGETNPASYTIESETITLKTPTREGYTFAGWTGTGLETAIMEVTIAKGSIDARSYTATWTPNQYTITFDSDGGSEVASITADYKSTLTKPADPTKEGYTFAGWNPAFPETMPLNGTALKATWTPNQYTITFDSDGGSEVASITADYKSTLTKPADPTKEGYTFAGWSPEVPATIPAEDKTFTAQWTINQYTITFDSDGGTAVAAITQDYGTVITAPANPTKEGYTFAGWDKAVPEAMPAENMTLKATWTPNEYTMTFVLDNGQENVVKKQDYGTELTAPENVAKTGYTFASWSPEVPATVPAGDKTFTAQWTINQYTITFDSNGGTAVAAITQDYGTVITAPANPTKEGYTFAGWDKAVPETMPAENMTLKATWTPNEYTMTFVLDNGQENIVKKQDYGTELTAPENVVKTGYTFAGWSPEVPATVPAEDKTFTAQWTINQYTITFDSNGGTAVAAITQDYGTVITAPANPTKEGYTFAGWDKAVPETMPAENMTLKATWTPNEYTMTFVLDNGQENVVKKQDYGTELTAPENVAKTGYTFAGWSPEVPATVPAGDKTFTAQWTINQYTITFDTDGGTTIAPITQNYATDVTAPADPTKEGYTFAGWDKAVPTKMPAEDMTLTAQWTPIAYSISYNGVEYRNVKGIYALQKDDVFTAGQVVDVKDGEDLVATITYSEAGEGYASFKAAKENSQVADFVAFTEGNGTNGNQPGGTFYTITPKYAGTIVAAVVLNANKNFYILEDGVALADYNGITVDEKYYGTYSFAVKAGKTYKIYAAGTKLGFYGFKYDVNIYDNPSYYTIETENFTLNNPTKDYYDFAGWTGTGLDQATMEVKIAKGNTGDRSYTSTWSPIGYTISYDLAGGQLAEGDTNPASYTIESEAITLKNPTREGYAFAGWTGTGIEGTSMAVTIAAGSTGVRSYTATWTPITYNLTYDLANGVLPEGKTNPVTYTIETEDITLVNPERTGYEFAGWTGTGLDKATVEVKIAKGSIGDRSYTATWTPIGYTISYDLAGGVLAEGDTNPASYTIESEAITLKNPTREGYAFAGWTGTGIEGTSMAVTIAAGSTGVRSYTATWTPITYTISYDLDGGQLAQGDTNPVEYTIESDDITLKNPTKDGYEFAGWTGNDLTEPTMEVIIAKGSTGNRSYTAIWTPASGIKAIFRDSKTVNVYTVNGTLVGRDMTVDEVIQLKHGIYVVNGKKIAIK